LFAPYQLVVLSTSVFFTKQWIVRRLCFVEANDSETLAHQWVYHVVWLTYSTCYIRLIDSLVIYAIYQCHWFSKTLCTFHPL